MKKLLLISVMLGVLSSCTSTSNGVTSGLYTSWKDRDPISRVDNSVNVTKKGTACVTNVLGLAAFGDSSIETAKKEGDLKNVAYVDRSYDGFLLLYIPVFQKGCTIVKGN